MLRTQPSDLELIEEESADSDESQDPRTFKQFCLLLMAIHHKIGDLSAKELSDTESDSVHELLRSPETAEFLENLDIYELLLKIDV